MAKYRKKPMTIEDVCVIDAVFWDGNLETLGAFHYGEDVVVSQELNSDAVQIATLEGTLTINVGCYIICNTNGEISPCEPDIFLEMYEAV